jgi:hypothetical protein
MTWAVASPPAGVRIPEQMPEADQLMAAPLIGLLVEESLGRPMLDLAHPRKAPDFAAAKRQRALLAVLALILICGGAYFIANRQLTQLSSRLRDAQDRGGLLAARYSTFLQDHARLSHIQEWTSARIDWLAHLRWLADQMPDPRQALLDGVAGTLKAAVSMNPKQDWYDKGGWSMQQQAALALQGHAKGADISRNFRERLLAARIYQVDTRGADTPDQFQYVLTTASPTPEPPPEPQAKSEKKNSDKPEKGGGQ